MKRRKWQTTEEYEAAKRETADVGESWARQSCLGLAVGLLLSAAASVGVAVETRVAEVCEGVPGYAVLAPAGEAGRVVVCQHDPGWSEAAWWVSSRDGRVPVQLPLYGLIVEGIEFHVCSGQELRIEVRHTTHMGTRTRTLFSVGQGEEGLGIISEWRHVGRGYLPEAGIDGCSGAAK